MPCAGRAARRRRLAAPRRGWRGRGHRHPRDLPDPRDPGHPRRPGGLRLCDAGPGLGRDLAGGHGGAACPLPATGGARRGAGRVCAVGTRGRLGRGGDAMHRHGRWRRLPAQRREDLDLQRRHCRFLRAVRPHGGGRSGPRRGSRLARHLGLHRRRRPARLRDCRAHRRHRAASARAPALHELPRAQAPDAGGAGRGIQAGDAHARCVPHLGRGGGPRLCPPCAAGGPGPGEGPADVWRAAGRPAADPGQAGRHGLHGGGLGPAGVPRGVAARPGPHDHPGGRDGQADGHRGRAARDRRRGAALRRPGRAPRRDRRIPLPRDPGAAHLRRRQRSAATHHRARALERLTCIHPPTWTASPATTCRRRSNGPSWCSTGPSCSSARG
mmetsp:Transcript_10053/g.40979  ORF Transcript_10053/g.40979 Transcript_10053/m.40979 type:complete len:384 (+) Transcript_10053:316-1467(+)